MRGIHIFSSVFTGMALTLLLGPQWGVLLGLLVYLAGSSTLQSRELAKLKRELHERMSDIPDLLSELVEQTQGKQEASLATKPTSERVDAPPPPVSPPPAEKDKPPPLAKSPMTLDQKMATLMDLLIMREAQSIGFHPTPPIKLDACPDKPEPGLVIPLQDSPPPRDASTPSSIVSEESLYKELESDLVAMRALVEKMTSLLAMQDTTKEETSVDARTPALPAQQELETVSAQRPSLQHLREELDKIAIEVRNELGRPNAK